MKISTYLIGILLVTAVINMIMSVNSGNTIYVITSGIIYLLGVVSIFIPKEYYKKLDMYIANKYNIGTPEWDNITKEDLINAEILVIEDHKGYQGIEIHNYNQTKYFYFKRTDMAGVFITSFGDKPVFNISKNQEELLKEYINQSKHKIIKKLRITYDEEQE